MTLEGVAGWVLPFVFGASACAFGWILRGVMPRAAVTEGDLLRVLEYAEAAGAVDAGRPGPEAPHADAYWRGYAAAQRDHLHAIHRRLGHPSTPCPCGAGLKVRTGYRGPEA